jgi:cleavage stimulation factor subunit 2
MRKECRLFVCNIGFDVAEDEVIKQLETVGKLVEFQMIYDKITGKSKGFCFCEYSTPEMSELAISTLKFSFDGRPVKITKVENFLPLYLYNQTAGKIVKDENGISANPVDSAMSAEFITLTLLNCNSIDLKTVFEHIKNLAKDNPKQLEKFLFENPECIPPIFYSLLRLNLISKVDILKIIDKHFNEKLKNFNANIKNCNEKLKIDTFEIYFNKVRNQLLKLKNYKQKDQTKAIRRKYKI